MSDSNEPETIEAAPETVQLVTFKVGETVLGVDVVHVQEINRQLDITVVPGANDKIHGVVNLRGDVVTVLDPHRIFGMQPSACPERQRNLILNVSGDWVGVLVDEVCDILTIRAAELTRRPSNVNSIDRQFIDSVCLRDEEIVVVLNSEQLLKSIEPSIEPAMSVA